MASDFTIRAVNNWRAAVHTDMATAARVSMDVWRREGTEATKHLLILMAQSAAAMTKQAQRRRKVQSDKHGEYVEILRQSGEASKRYRWQYSKPDARGTWEGAQTIRNRGLARRSWMWGFGKGHALSNVTVVDRVHSGGKSVGYQLTNRLGYIDTIMPPGYQAAAEQKAINKLMKQAEMKMVRAYEREINRTTGGRAAA